MSNRTEKKARAKSSRRAAKAARMAKEGGRSAYARKRDWLTSENNRRAENGQPAIMGMDVPRPKPWA